MSDTAANASLDQVLNSLQKMGVSTGGAAPAPVMPASASQAGGRRRKSHRKGRKSHRKSHGKSHRKSHRKSRKQNRKNRRTNRK